MRRGTARPQYKGAAPNGTGPAFVPTDIANLALWLDASDSSTITLDGSNNVSQWADKSGNGRDVSQANVTLRPSYPTGVFNGLPAVRFDGIDDRLNSASYSISQPLTMFATVRVSAVRSQYFIDGDTSRLTLYTSSANLRIFAGTVVGSATIPTTANTSFQATAIFNGANSSLRKDRALAEGSLNPGPNALGSPQLGLSGGGTNSFPLQGDIAEMLVYSRVLTAGEITQVEDYLAAKWNTP